jgi:lambda family phage portal protein
MFRQQARWLANRVLKPLARSIEGFGFGSGSMGLEAAGGGRRWRGANELSSPPSAGLASRTIIMRRARGAYSSQPHARAIVDAWVSSLIGPGIKASSKAPEGAETIDKAFAGWCERCDHDEQTNFGGLQAALARSMILTGDGFAAFVTDARGELRLKALASEQVASVSSDLAAGRWIIDGIEYDSDLRRVALHVYHSPPGLPLVFPSLQTDRILTADCIHIFRQDHVGLVRGLSWLSPVLLRLNDLDSVADGLTMRARVSAMHVGFCTTADGAPLGPESPRGEAPTMEPGALVNLQPGESITFAQPPQIGVETVGFMKDQLRACASGTGTPYEVISGDLENANYSSLRSSISEFRRKVEQIQNAIIIPQLRKIWRRWLLQEIMAGRIAAPGFEDDPEAWLAVSFLPPKWQAVDPLKDHQADLLDLQAGLRSRRELVAERGRDLEEIDDEIAADNERAKALGLAFNFATTLETATPEAAPANGLKIKPFIQEAAE